VKVVLRGTDANYHLLLHLADDQHRPIDPADIDLVEADEGNTPVGTRHAAPLVNLRQPPELLTRTSHLSARAL
jgi:hypothetical protein